MKETNLMSLKSWKTEICKTLGMLDYDKRLEHSFTAHPKVDPFTGGMFPLGYSHTPPYVTYGVISKDGFMHDPVPITISDPVMMHDFAISENYAIFMDLPLISKPKEMVKENKLIYSFDVTKKARLVCFLGTRRMSFQIVTYFIMMSILPSCMVRASKSLSHFIMF